MSVFHFDNNLRAEIKSNNGEVAVVVTDHSGVVKISGFPTEKDAYMFVMFADFDEMDNSFIITTGANYDLSWSSN